MSESVGFESEENWVVGTIQRALEGGQLEYACEVYEESGGPQGDEVLAGLKRVEGREVREAGAKMFLLARDFGRAARLYEHFNHWTRAAQQYEEAGEMASAGRCWQKGGELERAAHAFEAAGKDAEAIPLFNKLGDRGAAARCLLRSGKALEAAKLYRAAGNARGENDALRAVRGDDPARPAAVKRLVEVLAGRNRLADAAQLAAEALRENKAAAEDRELHDLLADLYDRLGQPGAATRVRGRLGGLVTEMAKAPGPPPARQPLPRESVTVPGAPQEGYGFLKAIPLFSKLSIDDMKDLYRMTSEVAFSPGQIVIEAGSDGRGLFVVIQGKLDILAVQPSGTKRLNTLGPGAYVGEVSLLGKAKTSARVAALDAVQALHIEPTQFEHYLQSRPSAALRIYRLFAENLAERVRALSAR